MINVLLILQYLLVNIISQCHTNSSKFIQKQNLNSYIDYLLLEAQTLTDEQLLMSLWEPIIESSDTTMVTTEWAMYELAKNPKLQVCNIVLSSFKNSPAN